jgi:hypothetical protein
MTAAAEGRGDVGTRFRSQLPDGDPSETQEWFGSLDGPSIVLRTLEELIARHELDSSVRDKAIETYKIGTAGDPTAGDHDGSAR